MSFRLVPKSVTLNDLERRNDSYSVLDKAGSQSVFKRTYNPRIFIHFILCVIRPNLAVMSSFVFRLVLALSGIGFGLCLYQYGLV